MDFGARVQHGRADRGRPPAGLPLEVALVFSNDIDAPGLKTAADAGIATAALDHRGQGGRIAFDAQVDAILREAGCELVALAGYMRLLSDAFVAAWPGRMINEIGRASCRERVCPYG